MSSRYVISFGMWLLRIGALCSAALPLLCGQSHAASSNETNTPVAPKSAPATKPASVPSISVPALKYPVGSSGTKTDAAQNRENLTEDDAYAAYQRGYFIEAFALATEMAGKGDAQAMTMLGHLYEVGQGIKRDLGRAVQWYTLGADRGDREAQVSLGLMYLSGTGVQPDIKRASDLFEAAAKQDQPVALFNLATMLIQGLGQRPDIPRARELMHKAAQLGNVEAQYSYALMLEADALPSNESEITYWMGLAARAGHVPAEVEYGLRLAKGRGAEKDLDTAVLFLNRAAWAGNAIAQNRIAHLIATGTGLPFNDVEAAKWHLLAKTAGVQDPELEDLLSTLKPDDLNRAKALAANWPGIPAVTVPGSFRPASADGAKFDLSGPLRNVLAPPETPTNPVATH